MIEQIKLIGFCMKHSKNKFSTFCAFALFLLNGFVEINNFQYISIQLMCCLSITIGMFVFTQSIHNVDATGLVGSSPKHASLIRKTMITYEILAGLACLIITDLLLVNLYKNGSFQVEQFILLLVMESFLVVDLMFTHSVIYQITWLSIVLFLGCTALIFNNVDHIASFITDLSITLTGAIVFQLIIFALGIIGTLLLSWGAPIVLKNVHLTGKRALS